MMLESLLHHIRQTAQHAGVRWCADCDAELHADAEELERRFARLEAAVRTVVSGTALLVQTQDELKHSLDALTAATAALHAELGRAQ